MLLTVQGITKLEGHVDSLYALTAGLEPYSLYSGGGDGYIAEWDVRDLKDARLLVRVPASIYAFNLVTDQQLLLIATRNGGLHLVDLKERKEKRLLKWSDSPLWTLCSCPEAGLMAVGRGDGMLTLLPTNRLDDLMAAISIPLSQAAIRSLAWNPNTSTLYAGASDGMIYPILLKEKGIERQSPWEAHRFSVFCLALQTEQNRLLSGGRDALLKAWSLTGAKAPLFSAPAHWYTLNHLLFSLDRQLLFTASRDKSIKIWDPKELELLKVLDWERYGIHTHSINRLCWQGDYLFSAGDDKKIGVWSVKTEQ